MSTRFPIIVLAFTVWAAPLRAQVRDTTAGPVFTGVDILRAAGFVAGVVALAPLDKTFAHVLQSPKLQENRYFETGATVFRFMGQPAPQIIGIGLYGLGRLTKSQDMQKLAVHGLEGMVLSTAITFPIKLLAGRARPYVFHDSAAYDFKLGRGLLSAKGPQGKKRPARDFQSFPSGHATTAFAVAGAVAAETSEWINRSNAWPGWKAVIGVTMYGGASLVGISRVYHDQHWATDVLAGAAIGTFSGIKVVRYAYRHPQNTIDRNLIAKRPTHPPVYLSFSLPL